MIAIIDADLGNVASIKNMLSYLGYESTITNNHAEIENATKLILPGVGSFDTGMGNLKTYNLIEPINIHVKKNKPLLGICLGMQLLGKYSEEGTEEGLRLVDSRVIKFRFNDENKKIPHMGWNYLNNINQESPLMNEISSSDRYYFVHSFHMTCENPKNVIAETDYHHTFTAAIQHKNVFGVQFHPEKSHHYGMKILSNFGNLNGTI